MWDSWSWSIVNYVNVRTGERCLKLVNMINPKINYNNYNPSIYILSMKPKSFIDSLIRKTERNFLLGCLQLSLTNSALFLTNTNTKFEC